MPSCSFKGSTKARAQFTKGFRDFCRRENPSDMEAIKGIKFFPEKKKKSDRDQRTNEPTYRAQRVACFLRRLQPKNKGLSQVPIG